jgi:tetratricopeptide (TPR) repeat protein
VEEGEALLRDALALFEKIGSAHNVARVLNTLAVVILWRSHGAAAQEAAREASRAHDIFERAGFAPGRYAALETLGQAMHALGRFEEARQHFERALASGPPSVASDARFHLGLMQLDQGRVDEARQAARELLELALAQENEPIQRMATFLCAAIAVREPRWTDRARGWLRRLSTAEDLDFELKRRLETLGAGLPASTNGVTTTDLVSDLREFLDLPA